MLQSVGHRRGRVRMFSVLFYLIPCVLLSLCAHVKRTDGQTAYPVCNTKRSACSCMTDKGLIDLTPLDSTTPDSPRFSNIDNPSTTDTYFYNPCTPFTKGTVGLGCTNVAVCQGFPKQNPAGWWNFGEHSSATFQNEAVTQKLQIKYTPTGFARSSVITLECNPLVSGTLTFVSETLNNAVFTLTSKYACPGKGGGGGGGGGLSTGGILCIVFLVVVVVYIFGGVLFLHFFRGAEGVEKIPNVSFWRQAPGLVRDGCLFVVNPIRAALFGYSNV